MSELTEQQKLAFGRAIEQMVLNGAQVTVCRWLADDAVAVVNDGNRSRVFCGVAAEAPLHRFVEDARKELGRHD